MLMSPFFRLRLFDRLGCHARFSESAKSDVALFVVISLIRFLTSPRVDGGGRLESSERFSRCSEGSLPFGEEFFKLLQEKLRVDKHFNRKQKIMLKK